MKDFNTKSELIHLMGDMVDKNQLKIVTMLNKEGGIPTKGYIPIPDVMDIVNELVEKGYFDLINIHGNRGEPTNGYIPNFSKLTD